MTGTRNPNNILTGIYDGDVYWAPAGSPLPNGFTQDLETLGYTKLGWLDDSNPPAVTYPGQGDATPVRVWQRAAVVRTIRMPSDESPTFTMTLAEITRRAIEICHGATVAADGSFVVNSAAERPRGIFVIDVITEVGARRHVAPNATVTEVGEQAFSNDGAIVGLPITVSADMSAEINGNLRIWDIALTDDLANGLVSEFQPWDENVSQIPLTPATEELTEGTELDEQ